MITQRSNLLSPVAKCLYKLQALCCDNQADFKACLSLLVPIYVVTIYPVSATEWLVEVWSLDTSFFPNMPFIHLATLFPGYD